MTPATLPLPRQRSLLGVLVATAVVSAAVAAMLTLVVATTGGFGSNLLVSESIGLSIVAWVMLLRRLPLVRRLGGGVSTLVVTLVATPLGYLSGFSFASFVRGWPLEQALTGSGRVVAITTTLLVTGVIGYVAWMRGRIANEAAARSEAQRLAAEAQLRLLRTQIEPHMLFNTLATLRSLVDDDPKLAQAMIDQLITYLRSALTASRTEAITLRQEFAQLRAYLEIMALRMGHRLAFSLDLPDALQGVTVPPMLLQPLVENAIKHGLEPKVGGGRIDVAAQRDERGVGIVITDTGLGLPLEAGRVGEQCDGEGGYGLRHVRERLAVVYGPQASLTLDRHAPHGVCATIRIPA